MQDAIGFIARVVTTVLGFVVTVILSVNGALRHAMDGSGIQPQIQSVVLVTAAVLMIVLAYRIFGGLIGILITIFLLLMIVQAVAPTLLGGAG